MKRAPVVGLALAALQTLPASATELELGVTSGVAYQDNVFPSRSGPQGDWLGTLAPRIRLVDELGAVTWNLQYRPLYEKYLKLDAADDWDQDVYGTLTWNVSPRTTLRLTDRYLDTSHVSTAFTETGGPDPFVEPILELETNRVKFNQLSASLDHQLTARQVVTFSFGSYDTDYGGGSETTVRDLGLSVLYALQPVDRVGFALSAVQQDAGAVSVYYYNGSLRWVHRFDRTLSLTASAGPAWVDRPPPDFVDVLPGRSRYPLLRTDRGDVPILASTCTPAGGDLVGLFVLSSATCQPVPAGTQFGSEFRFEVVDLQRLGDEPPTGSQITYFANASLAKQWHDFAGSLSYSRGASTTSQLSGVVSDTLTLSVTWVPTARPWRASAWVSYGRREFPGGGVVTQQLVRSSTLQGVDDVAESAGFRLVEVERNQTIDVYRVGIYVSYEIAPRVQTYLNAWWSRDEYEFEFSGPVAPQIDRFRVSLGLTYTTDRINLPF